MPRNSPTANVEDARFMREALRLAKRSYGNTSPNPLVGSVLVKRGEIIGRGWHRKAGSPHAEIDALRDAAKNGHSPKGATIYVTLEPCCTHGRTPPCTEAIQAAGIRRVVVAATDPNPKHAGRAFDQLRAAKIKVANGVLSGKATEMNTAFNHWIVNGTPYVTVKAAMTLDGKIATASGESKWITSEKSRSVAQKIRLGNDAMLVGVNTVLADDPSLTVRKTTATGSKNLKPDLRRIILDSQARTPLTARVVADEFAERTTIVITDRAPKSRAAALARKTNVIKAPLKNGRINLSWLLARLGKENVVSLLVEGGGQVNASFLSGGHAHEIAFFYAPKILGGADSLKGVAGTGAASLTDAIQLHAPRWRQLGDDLLLVAKIS